MKLSCHIFPSTLHLTATTLHLPPSTQSGVHPHTMSITVRIDDTKNDTGYHCNDIVKGIQGDINTTLQRVETECSQTGGDGKVASAIPVLHTFVKTERELLLIAAEGKTARVPAKGSAVDIIEDERESANLNWKKQRQEVLQTYTTDKDIAIHSKIMAGENEEDGSAKKATQTDLAKQRLEQLDAGEGKKKDDGMSYFSQKEMLAHLERLAADLETAWDRGEKVKTLRIVIQACKLLSVIKVPQCYPSLFVLAAKVLDTFGDLVYDRIYEKAVESLGVKKLSRDFTPADLSLDTKEMCKNWFYKVASIRELVPRILVEMALWRCNRFIKRDPDFFSKTFARFVKQVRGIGDPLLAFHARWYVSHKAQEINEEFRESLTSAEENVPMSIPVSCDHARLALSDFYFCLPQVAGNHEGSDEERLAHYLRQTHMTFDEYITLFAPVSRWLIEVVSGENQNVETLDELYEQCQQNGGYSVVILHMIRAFKPDLVRERFDLFLSEIEHMKDKTCLQTDMLTQLGLAMTLAPPESKSTRVAILKKALEILVNVTTGKEIEANEEDANPKEGDTPEEAKADDADKEKEKEKDNKPEEKKPKTESEKKLASQLIVGKSEQFIAASFFACARAWIAYAMASLDGKEVNRALTRIYDKIHESKMHELDEEGLERLIFIMVDSYGGDNKSLQKLFGIQSFLSLVDLLSATKKRTFCYRLASLYVEVMKKGKDEVMTKTSNTIIANGLLDLFRSIHDSMTPLTPQDEIDVFSYLLIAFISTVDYASPPTSDFEAQLNFLAECRKSFHKSEAILVYTITLVAELIDRIVAVSPVKSHSKKSGLFVKVCLVFCSTTICAVTNSATRASLLLACGYMAIHHGFLSHGDQLMASFAEELSNVVSADLEAVTAPLFKHIHNAVCPDNTGLAIVSSVLEILKEEQNTGPVKDSVERYNSNKGKVYCGCFEAVVRLYKKNDSQGVFLLDDAQEESSALHVSKFHSLAGSIVASIEEELSCLQTELARSSTPPNMHITIKKSIMTLSYRLFESLLSGAEVCRGHGKAW